MSKISKEQEYKIKANVLDHLINHLRDRSDVQNIDLMNLSGFCRNCLSKWYVKYAKEENFDLDYEESRKIIYGMTYSEWKSKYQSEATKEQVEQNIEQFTEDRNEALYDLYEMKRETLAFNEGGNKEGYCNLLDDTDFFTPEDFTDTYNVKDFTDEQVIEILEGMI